MHGTLFRAGLVVSMSTLSANGIGCMDWPDPPLMLIQHSMYIWDILQKHTSFRPAQPKMRDDLANALI